MVSPLRRGVQERKNPRSDSGPHGVCGPASANLHTQYSTSPVGLRQAFRSQAAPPMHRQACQEVALASLRALLTMQREADERRAPPPTTPLLSLRLQPRPPSEGDRVVAASAAALQGPKPTYRQSPTPPARPDMTPEWRGSCDVILSPRTACPSSLHFALGPARRLSSPVDGVGLLHMSRHMAWLRWREQ